MKVLTKKVIVNKKKEYLPNTLIDVEAEGFNWTPADVVKMEKKGLISIVDAKPSAKPRARK